MILRTIVAFLAAVVVAAALAAAANTQFVLAELTRLGIDVGLGDRLAMTGQDIVGMTPLYLPVFGVGLLVAFSVAAVLIRFLLPSWGQIGYTLAGAAAVVAIMVIAMQTFGLMPVAGARTFGGMVAQGLAGAVGGFVFGRILLRRPVAG